MNTLLPELRAPSDMHKPGTYMGAAQEQIYLHDIWHFEQHNRVCLKCLDKLQD